MSEQLENKEVKTATKSRKKKELEMEDVSAIVESSSETKFDIIVEENVIVEESKVETLKNKEPEMKRTSGPVKTNGQIYEAYIKELKNFKLIYNGDVVYDSTLSKNNSNLKFEADYFVLFGRKYSYNGLRIQKI